MSSRVSVSANWWSQDEIAAHLGKDTFTPNFESEYTHYILPALGK